LVRFGRPSRIGGAGDKPETFDFLGFTHYWGKSVKGNQVVKKKTAKGRFRRTLQAIKKWGMEHRHLPMKEQQRKLNEKLRGHDCYYGVTGNIRMLSRLRYEVTKLWRRWLQWRNRSSSPNWEKFQGMLRVFPLFPARIIFTPACNETTTPRNRMRSLRSSASVGGRRPAFGRAALSRKLCHSSAWVHRRNFAMNLSQRIG